MTDSSVARWTCGAGRSAPARKVGGGGTQDLFRIQRLDRELGFRHPHRHGMRLAIEEHGRDRQAERVMAGAEAGLLDIRAVPIGGAGPRKLPIHQQLDRERRFAIDLGDPPDDEPPGHRIDAALDDAWAGRGRWFGHC